MNHPSLHTAVQACLWNSCAQVRPSANAKHPVIVHGGQRCHTLLGWAPRGWLAHADRLAVQDCRACSLRLTPVTFGRCAVLRRCGLIFIAGSQLVNAGHCLTLRLLLL